MNSSPLHTASRLSHRPPRVAAALAVALALAACADHELPPVASSPAPARPAPGVTTMQPRELPANTPTASNVLISDEIRRACGISDADAYFPFDSSRLTPTDSTGLEKVADCFAHGALAGRPLKLVGHADPRGGADYNVTLGQSRADAVGAYLGEHGVARPNLTTTSRGAMDATGTDEATWSRDRRVDVMLSK